MNDIYYGLLEKIVPNVDEIMNEHLTKPFTPEDVKQAAFGITDLKAPGPDGLHAIFFKRCWHLIGEEITMELLAAIQSGHIPDWWNDTNSVLIPKVDVPESIAQ